MSFNPAERMKELIDKYNKEGDLSIQELMELNDLNGKLLYSLKPNKNDINLVRKVADKLNDIKKGLGDRFLEIMKRIEPDIENKKDIVQQIILTTTLLPVFYRLKNKVEDLRLGLVVLYLHPKLEKRLWLEGFENVLMTMVELNVVDELDKETK